MSIEIEFRKMLEEKGFKSKKTKIGSIFTYDHPEYKPVNYHVNSRTISFNYLGKYMRDEVRETHGTLIGIEPAEKERLYRKALSKLDLFKNIEHHISFSLRASGNDYVGISDIVGINILDDILRFITGDATSVPEGTERPALQSVATTGYTPNNTDREFALRQLAKPGTDVPISQVEDQIEKNMAERNIHLAPNWRKSKK